MTIQEKPNVETGVSRTSLIETELFKVPDMDLIQCRYNLKSSDVTLVKAAKEKLDSAIDQYNMAPFYKYLCAEEGWPVYDDMYYEKLCGVIESQLALFDSREKDATENLGESEVFSILVEKAIYLCQVADKERALSALRIIQEKAVAMGTKLDIIFAMLRIGFFYKDFDILHRNLEKASSLMEQGGDWERRNRLKTYRAMVALLKREFPSAATLFMDTLSTFTYTELISVKSFIKYTVLSSMVALSRVDLKTKILSSPEVLEVIDDIPSLHALLKSFYECQYRDYFLALANMESQMLSDHWIATHCRYIVKELRLKAYRQLLESYKSVTIVSMAQAFGVSEEYIDKELFKWISAGRLNCIVDKVAGTVETTHRPNTKNAQYQELVKNGDLLLNRLQKLGRVIHA